jgi:hypothetical protein
MGYIYPFICGLPQLTDLKDLNTPKLINCTIAMVVQMACKNLHHQNYKNSNMPKFMI